MSKYLVIVESPSKAAKISQYLGKDYLVMSSKGHVVDLPKKGLNVNIKKNFEPNYEVMEDKKDVVDKIISESKKAELIFLASDLDREGEAIAWHLSNKIPKDKPFKRAKTNSITKEAVKNAIAQAGDIDIHLVESYEARRILDRLVGYKCSFLTQTATGGRSAGRVQSAALRALCEREKEILSFIPEEYWDISADAITIKNEKFPVKLTKPDKMEVKNEIIANKIVEDIKDRKSIVSKYEVKEVFSSPYAPFTTSSLQQSAASILGWSQDKTMSIAQNLYESGKISYHRTDSPYIEPNSILAIRTEIENRYGKKYLPEKQNYYSPKSQNAQEAHEAIRPTYMDCDKITDSDLDGQKLYDLIWKRTISSQMSKSIASNISLRLNIDNYELGANGNTLVFDGWKKVWHYSLSDDTLLPLMKIGDECKIENVEAKQKFTQPPPRYTKSSITKLYEETGIGRPSTYAAITKTLLARDYISLQKNAYHVTDLGMKVSDFLVKSDFCFVDLNFTSDLEEKLDKIANNKMTKLDVLGSFWERLQSDIKKANSIKSEASQTDIPCPKCSALLLLKHGKFGTFFACPNKKETGCDYTANIGEDGKPKVKAPKEYASFSCDKCGSKMVKRNSSMGVFFGCEKYPKCKSMKTIERENIEQKEKSPNKYKKYSKYKKKK